MLACSWIVVVSFLFVIVSSLSLRLKKPAEYYSIVPYEFYERMELRREDNSHTLHMYNLIFGSMDLGHESCNIMFQNCLLNSDNNVHAICEHHLITSSQCFPLRKAKYCLQKSNYIDTTGQEQEVTCEYKRIHDRVKFYNLHLHRNMEACQVIFPVSKEDEQAAAELLKQLSSNRASQVSQATASAIIVLILSIPLILYFK